MAYIYIITNKINHKSYIGKTEYSDPNKRWNEHCNDYKREYYKNRPLYKAFAKYGLNNFEFKVLLETNTPEKDEIKLIKEYDTYSKGYNATLGGDGKKLITPEKEQEIINYYLTDPLKISYNKLAIYFNYDLKTIKKILKDNNIDYTYTQSNRVVTNCKKINQYDLNNNLINTFKSAREAARHLGNEKKNSHIIGCCNNKRKTAFNYIWKWE